MTVNQNQKINLLIETIKGLSFFSRLFNWKSVKEASIEAGNEYKNLISEYQKLASLAEKSESLMRDISDKKVEVESLKSRLESKDKDIVRLEENNKNLQDKVQESVSKVAGLTGLINAHKQEFEQKQTLIAQLEESKNYLNQQIAGLKGEIATKDGELNHLNNKITETGTELAKINAQNNGKSERIIELQAELESLKAKLSVINEEKERYSSEKVRFEEEIKNKSQEILILEKEITGKEEIIINLQNEVQKLKTELAGAKENINNNSDKITELKSDISAKEEGLKHLQQDIKNNLSKIAELDEAKKQGENRIKNLETEKAVLNSSNENIIYENQTLKRQIASWEENSKKRDEEHMYKVEKLQMLIEQVEKDREKIKTDKENELKEKFENMKRAWKNHEDNVKKSLLEICRRNDVEYVEEKQLPFKGKPDNTINIAGEYIIFDAKCPMNDDLENFPKYIQSQAELLKKYAKEDRVKKDIFLIVPSNTISTDDTDKKPLKTLYYNMTDYRVFVIALDSLEPVILSLKKVEEYEFAEQLSPEDRDNICRIIAKFAHTAKRKIQIDSFLNQRFADILRDCNVLPVELRDKVVKMETSDKLNPPQDRRNKNNSQKEIENDIKMIGNIAHIAEINLDSKIHDDINRIPLLK